MYQLLTRCLGSSCQCALSRSAELCAASLRVSTVWPGGAHDAILNHAAWPLLEHIGKHHQVQSTIGKVEGVANDAYISIENRASLSWRAESQIQQTVEAAIFADQQILKVFRRIEPAAHPELEVGRLIDGNATKGRVPRLMGRLNIAAETRTQEHWRSCSSMIRNPLPPGNWRRIG